MYRHLAAELSRYYTDVSPSLRVFYNGMNQNHVVDEMALVGRMEFEASQLSRAIQGKRLLDDNQLYVFSKVLGLSEEQLWRLYHATAKDLCERKGLEIDIATAPPVINILIRNAARISEAIDDGALTRAIDMLADLYAARAALDDSEISAPPLLRVLSLAEIEHTRILDEIDGSSGALSGDSAVTNVEIVDTQKLMSRAASAPASDIETRFWRMYYVDGIDVDEIAQHEDLTVETVYAVLERWKGRLLQHLAEDPDE